MQRENRIDRLYEVEINKEKTVCVIKRMVLTDGSRQRERQRQRERERKRWEE